MHPALARLDMFLMAGGYLYAGILDALDGHFGMPDGDIYISKGRTSSSCLYYRCQ